MRTTIATEAAATPVAHPGRSGRPHARESFAARSSAQKASTTLSLLILYAPFLAGLLISSPELSIAWSFIGSIFIAAIVQTRLLQPSNRESIARSLLRPTFMFHMIFIAYHVMGGAIHALNEAGYVLLEPGVAKPSYEPTLLAESQRLMLFAHATVSAGMSLMGLRYDRPAYRFSFSKVPPFGLLVFGVLAQSVGTLMRSYSSLFSFGDKLMALGVAAVLVQVALSVREKKYLSLIQSSVVFGVTVASQALSGWKGSVLWTAIALGAWLFPLYPKVTASVGVVFVAFWGLWFYPFATSLRRPLWYEGVTQERAVEIALDQTRDLTLRERAETLWELLSVRGSDLKHFAKYVAFVPETRSFYGWELVGNSITALTPRLLWPDKPDIERLSMERVYEAGITAEEVIVSAKTNLYQDGYLSGGYTGVFLFCLSFGILAMWISQTCERFFGGYEYGTGLMYFGLFATPINLALNVEFMISGLAGSALVALLMFAVARSAGWLVKDTASALDARH